MCSVHVQAKCRCGWLVLVVLVVLVVLGLALGAGSPAQPVRQGLNFRRVHGRDVRPARLHGARESAVLGGEPPAAHHHAHVRNVLLRGVVQPGRVERLGDGQQQRLQLRHARGAQQRVRAVGERVRLLGRLGRGRGRCCRRGGGGWRGGRGADCGSTCCAGPALSQCRLQRVIVGEDEQAQLAPVLPQRQRVADERRPAHRVLDRLRLHVLARHQHNGVLGAPGEHHHAAHGAAWHALWRAPPQVARVQPAGPCPEGGRGGRSVTRVPRHHARAARQHQALCAIRHRLKGGGVHDAQLGAGHRHAHAAAHVLHGAPAGQHRRRLRHAPPVEHRDACRLKEVIQVCRQ
mmetsp:Transcript_9600/g.23799  ORF Transcript_9600/g.23799 Transcript_9600/m.23799 type:complete len:347 (-) Transcript_9600:1609-2649(-)